MDNQSSIQPQVSQSDNSSTIKHDELVKDYENLEHGRKLITIAFIIFIVVLLVVGYAMISDLNCQCEYDVCFCGANTFAFGFFAIVPAIISTILASKGMRWLKMVNGASIEVPRSYRMMGLICLWQIPFFIVMVAIWYALMSGKG